MVRRVLEQDWSPTPAAEAAGVSERTAAKWLGRWRAEGEAGLEDRSSAPKVPAIGLRPAGSRRSRRCGGCG